MWFYRYILRGLGVVLIAGLITILVLTLHSQLDQPSTGEGDRPQKNQGHTDTPSSEGWRPK